MAIRLLPERLVPRHRLGRHVQFDERSKSFRVSLPSTEVVTRLWERSVPAFDQGELGSCTGQGAAGLLCTEPFRVEGWTYTDKLAVFLYQNATEDDEIEGSFPPTDTGSTVLAAMKATTRLGYAKSYLWCFGLDDALRTLSQAGPIEVGINWYEGFDEPDKNGRIRFGGDVRGGHAFEILGVETDARLVTAINSWGPEWGKDGRFTISWDDLERLLYEDGEAATLVV